MLLTKASNVPGLDELHALGLIEVAFRSFFSISSISACNVASTFEGRSVPPSREAH